MYDILKDYSPLAEVSPKARALPGSSSNWCPKCVVDKSGKPSCCARGGAWFNKCGDASDTQFDHTWAEGIQACKSKICSEFKLSVMYRDGDGDCVVWWTSRHWN